MASIDLNALEIGAVLLPEEDHRMRSGIDSCAAVIAFPKSVADDFPMLLIEHVPCSHSTSKTSTTGSCSSLSASEQIKEMMVRAASVDHPN